MHAVFFEMRAHAGHMQHYFDHVARLRPVLARHAGLAFLDRYGALGDSGLLLSHQLWESEEAIAAWRRDATHRTSQAAGRHEHFADYRIRVGERVVHWRADAPDAAVGGAAGGGGPHVLALYGRKAVDAPGFAAFESVNHQGQFIALATADGFDAARAMLAEQIGAPGLDAAAAYSIHRDYGQFDRAQAPR